MRAVADGVAGSYNLPNVDPNVKRGRLLGGPYDGVTVGVYDHTTFVIIPDGGEAIDVPDLPEGFHMQIIKPDWAFYQHIEGADYFYVRTISDEEVSHVLATGQMPDPKGD
jgi:hypothetical protein